MNTKVLNSYELDCIRFYMGDPEIVNRGDFIGGPQAYNTINALLHKGVTNETEKIAEGKPIEILNPEHLKQIVSLTRSIDASMKKANSPESPLVTYRIDRISEINSMREKGRIEGFYSTCKYGFLKEYANTKQNIALMEIHREPDVPFLDFEVLFQDLYAKPQEAEILLPFGSVVCSVEELPLTEEERTLYHDMHGNPPCGKFRIHLAKRKPAEISASILSFDELTSKDNACRIERILQTLTSGGSLTSEDRIFYLNWKKAYHGIFQ